MWKRGVACVALFLAGRVLAQESPDYRIQGGVMNAGGDPRGGVDPASPSYLVRPDALGDGAVVLNLLSASYQVRAGSLLSFPTPGAIQDLVFTNGTTLTWSPSPLAAHYHLYRTPGLGPGTGIPPLVNCLQSDLPAPTAADAATPSSGFVFFYFASAVNDIRIEGPIGAPGGICP